MSDQTSESTDTSADAATGDGATTADKVYTSTAQGADEGGADDGADTTSASQGAAGEGDGQDGAQGDADQNGAGDGDGADDGAAAEPVLFEYAASSAGEDSPIGGLVEAVNAAIKDGGDRDAALTAAAKWAEEAMTSGAQKVADAITQWREALEKDSEFGGDKFPETVQRIEKAFDALGDPEFKSLLEGNGMKYHPALAKGLIQLSEMVTGDKFEGGGGKPAIPLPDQIYHTTRANGG